MRPSVFAYICAQAPTDATDTGATEEIPEERILADLAARNSTTRGVCNLRKHPAASLQAARHVLEDESVQVVLGFARAAK